MSSDFNNINLDITSKYKKYKNDKILFKITTIKTLMINCDLNKLDQKTRDYFNNAIATYSCEYSFKTDELQKLVAVQNDTNNTSIARSISAVKKAINKLGKQAFPVSPIENQAHSKASLPVFNNLKELAKNVVGKKNENPPKRIKIDLDGFLKSRNIKLPEISKKNTSDISITKTLIINLEDNIDSTTPLKDETQKNFEDFIDKKPKQEIEIKPELLLELYEKQNIKNLNNDKNITQHYTNLKGHLISLGYLSMGNNTDDPQIEIAKETLKYLLENKSEISENVLNPEIIKKINEQITTIDKDNIVKIKCDELSILIAYQKLPYKNQDLISYLKNQLTLTRKNA